MCEDWPKNALRSAPVAEGVFSGQVRIKSGDRIYLTRKVPSTVGQEIKGSLFISILNLVPMGVILTDEHCRAILFNRAAEKVLVKHDGLRLQNDIVVATSSRESRALRKLVRNTVQISPSGQIRACAAMTVSRPSFRRAYEIVVVGLPVPELVHGSRTMAAVLFIGQQEVEMPSVELVIAGLYGLTPAESRVAAKLMRGVSLSQVSAELRITRETARTHLRNIFAKTQTNRQSELVRLLVGGPSNVCLQN